SKGPKIPVIAIHGTHERRTKDLINPVQIFELAGFFINVHNSKAVFEKDGDRVAVQAIGGVPEDYAINVFKSSNIKPVESAFNIFMLHQTLKDFIPADIDCLSIEDLPKGFDLYVCGHLHAKRISEEKKILIPGSTVITQLREGEDGEKGFWLYDTQTRKAEYVPIPVRPFFFREIELNGANLGDIEKSCKETIESILKNSQIKPILKIKLKGTLAKGLLSGNLDLTSLVREYDPKLFLEIDKDFETNTSERVESIRSFREKKASIKDLGLDILKKRLKESNVEIENVEELFNLLSDDYEAALKKIMEK
ncbi:hypothetical protein HY570_01385, partial [Candidatus Micrarchaeota archaeon]|nr:hypothetical protein [Candidatus Micrarchaeota archaeon]